ncbi:organic solute transporter Ostalpha-domain-containing protein [Spinellus fusiger]|nr:organic solute transporter Ostalpha-domain-containing protein [Spinellus fusiger]KAI7873020.1 organic solute transporter Ostalpha-domain-containing protein [Spinellus fusiger]
MQPNPNSHLYSSNMHVWGWLASGFLTLGSFTIAAHSITRHLTHYHSPHIQRHKVRVLAYPPAYAVLAWLTYLKYDYATLIMFFAKIVESFAVYNLYVCLQAYLAPYRQKNEGAKVESVTKVLGFYKFHLQSKWGLHFRVIIEMLVYQFPIWNIIASLISIFTHIKGVYCDGQFTTHGAYLYLATISFISLSVILMALFTYLSVFDEEWKHGNIRAHGMFWCVKGPIMVIFYFGDILLSIMTFFEVIHDSHPAHGGTVWTAEAIKNGYYVLLICAVMVVVAALMERYFGLRISEENLDEDRYGYVHAFADSFLAFVPQFLLSVFLCGGNTVVLAKKRILLHKQRRLSEEERNLLMPYSDTFDSRIEDPLAGESPSHPVRSHQSNVYGDDRRTSPLMHTMHSMPLEALAQDKGTPPQPVFEMSYLRNHQKEGHSPFFVPGYPLSEPTTVAANPTNPTTITTTTTPSSSTTTTTPSSSTPPLPSSTPPPSSSSTTTPPPTTTTATAPSYISSSLPAPMPSLSSALSSSDQVDPNRPNAYPTSQERKEYSPGYF